MNQFEVLPCPKFPSFGGFITMYPPTIPKFYWDVHSQEQRIKQMCCYIDSLVNYVDALNEQEQNDYTDLLARLTALRSELINRMDELTYGMSQWDCQTGTYEQTKIAQRDMFNDLSVHSITVTDLVALDLTVDELANCGLNVRGLAVMSYWLVDSFALPHDFTDIGDAGDTLTVEQLRRAKVRFNDGVVNVPADARGLNNAHA